MEPVTPIPGFRFAPRLLALSMAALIAAGCSGGGGDVNLDASQSTTINDNSTTNSGGGGSTNPCANYIDPETNTRAQGTFDGTNCVYGPEFVGEDNPLPVSLTIPFITGVHVFEDTLQVGKFVDGTNPNETVPQSGAGPTLTIRAGNKLAWTNPDDYLLVNRGSRIIAEGTSVWQPQRVVVAGQALAWAAPALVRALVLVAPAQVARARAAVRLLAQPSAPQVTILRPQSWRVSRRFSRRCPKPKRPLTRHERRERSRSAPSTVSVLGGRR